MKNKANRIISALLALLMLALAVPMAVLVGHAEGSDAAEPAIGTVLNNPALAKGNFKAWYDKNGDGVVTEEYVNDARCDETTVLDEEGYYTQTVVAPNLPAISAVSGSIMGFANNSDLHKDAITGRDAEGNLLVSRDKIAFEISLGRVDNPYPMTIRPRFSIADASGKATFLGTASDGSTKLVTIDRKASNDYTWALIVIDGTTGNVTFSPSGTLIGNIKEENVDISMACIWSENDGWYVVNVYVNGKLAVEDYAWKSVGSDVTLSATVDGVTYSKKVGSTKDLHDGAIATINEFQFYSANKTYSSENGDFYTTPNGEGKYEIKYLTRAKDLYFVFGTDSFHIKANADAYASKDNLVCLFTNGKTIEGYTTVGNYSYGIILNSAVSDGYATLPEIEDGWRDPVTNEIITKVPVSVFGSEEPAAYTLPASKLLNDGTVTQKYEYVSNWTGESKDRIYNLKLKDHPYGNGVGDISTMTIATTLIPLTADAPYTQLRIRSEGWHQNNVPLMEVNKSENGLLTFFDSAVKGPKLEQGKAYDIVLTITIKNETALTATATITAYVNGVCYGTKSMLNNWTINSPIAAGGSDPNLRNVQFYCGSGTGATNPYQRKMEINDFRVYAGTAESQLPVIENLSGASIRLDKNTDASGLRFSFRIAKEKFDALNANGNATVGALIAPADWLESGALTELTHAAMTDLCKALDLTVNGFANESDEDYYYFNASIVKLLAQNFAREFVAVGYIKVGETYYYSYLSDSRSIIDVALKYGNSAEYASASAEHKAIADAYRSKVVYLTVTEEGALLETVEGYKPAYEVTYEGGVLTLTGEGVKGIATIVLNGEAYTDGWTKVDGEDKITAPFVLS